MTTRAQELAAAFVARNDTVIKTIEALTNEQWRVKTAVEGWPVCVVAQHIVARSGIEELERILSGDPTPYWTDTNELDARNAQDAREFADCTKDETLELLRHFSSRAEQLIAGLTDDQLKARGEVVIRGSVTVEQWVGIMMLNHAVAHHTSIVQTIS